MPRSRSCAARVSSEPASHRPGAALDQADALLELKAEIEQMRFEPGIPGQADQQVALLRQVAQVMHALNQSLPNRLGSVHFVPSFISITNSGGKHSAPCLYENADGRGGSCRG